jgi:hypothetical protein
MSGRSLGSFDVYGQQIRLYEYEYSNRRVAISGETPRGEPFATLSVNVPDEEGLQEDEFIFPQYKLDILPEILESMRKSPLFEDTGKRANFGLVVDQPIFKIVRRPS